MSLPTPPNNKPPQNPDSRLARLKSLEARLNEQPDGKSGYSSAKGKAGSARSERSLPRRVDLSALNRLLGKGSEQSEEAPQTIEGFKDSMAKEEQELILSDEAGVVTAKQRASSWGLSVFVHAVIILILTFVFFPLKPQPRELEAVFSTEIGDQLDFLTDDSGNLNPNDADNYAFTVPEELKVEDAVVFEKRELPFESDVAAPIFDQSRIEMSDMLSGRTDPGLKNDLLSKYGGNKTTEESVEAALRWLRRQQEKDGSWSLNGPYKDGIHSLDNRPAATALALLAFQGAGNTRESGEHSIAVRRGWTWLLKQQNADGSFAPSIRSSEALFYTQAICTIALCEMITLEKSVSSSVRKQAKAAVDYLLENQHAKLGGWKYAPQESSDLSVTGWCVMALKTAEMANISIPESNYKRVSAYLDSISYDDGAGYVYQLVSNEVTEAEKRPSMTATGLMCREYLGWSQTEPALLRGAATLASDENLIRFPESEEEIEENGFFHNVYGWYSTSMALKGLGPYNKYWRRWNTALSRELPKQQEPQSSDEAGSWDPKYDEYSFGGGRLYVTCLCVLCLEVYYRHLSIYR